MIKKSIQLLKRNPVLILFYSVYMIISYLILFSLYPKDLSVYTNPATFQFAGYFTMMGKMFAAIILILIFGLLFFAGFGNMLSEALIQGKTSAASFSTGIQRFFVRVFLAALLLIAFSIGFSIILSIFIVAAAFLLAFHIELLQIVSALISFVTIVFIMPFVLLWFPSIFVDDTGVMMGLRYGAKAGIKNYWKLILLMIVLYLPVIPTVIFNYNDISNGRVFTPGYFIMFVVSAIVSAIIVPILFIIYKDYKDRFGNLYHNGNGIY